MTVKSKSKIEESAKSGNLKEAIKQANNSSINIISDGIKRIDLSKIDANNNQENEAKGYLVIHSGAGTEKNKHLALKANKDSFWTISASKNGESLNIGRFVIGEDEIKPIITFKEDTSLILHEPLSLNRLKPAYKAKKEKDSEKKEQEAIKGIATSGFKGYESGIMEVGSGWQTILKIPKGTFGKYKLEAWVVNDKGKGISNLEYTFVFFSDKFPVEIEKKVFKSINFFTRQWLKFTRWLVPKNRRDTLVYGKDITVNRILQEASKLKVKARKTTTSNNEEQIEIKIKTKYTPKKCKIYFYIERIWEGSNWINE